MPNFKSVVLFLLVDFGWWVTILGMVVDHPVDGERPSMALHLVLILLVKSMCQIPSLQYTLLLVDSGWWVTIFGMLGDHPWHFT